MRALGHRLTGRAAADQSIGPAVIPIRTAKAVEPSTSASPGPTYTTGPAESPSPSRKCVPRQRKGGGGRGAVPGTTHTFDMHRSCSPQSARAAHARPARRSVHTPAKQPRPAWQSTSHRQDSPASPASGAVNAGTGGAGGGPDVEGTGGGVGWGEPTGGSLAGDAGGGGSSGGGDDVAGGGEEIAGGGAALGCAAGGSCATATHVMLDAVAKQRTGATRPLRIERHAIPKPARGGRGADGTFLAPATDSPDPPGRPLPRRSREGC